jgi:hypothetical protein
MTLKGIAGEATDGRPFPSVPFRSGSNIRRFRRQFV